MRKRKTSSSENTDELTSSDSSDSEPEDASTKNLSTGWTVKVTRGDTQSRVDTQFETIVGPTTSQTTSTSRTPHFPCSKFSSRPISGDSCAGKQTCKPSRSKQSKTTSYCIKNFNSSLLVSPS